MRNLFKKIFCMHKYIKVSWYEEYDKERNLRYPVRLYRCAICGKKIQIDGRNDTLKNRY